MACLVLSQYHLFRMRPKQARFGTMASWARDGSHTTTRRTHE